MKVLQSSWRRGVQVIALGLLAIAAVGTAAYSQTTNLPRPLIQIGSQGAEVSELQAALKLLGFFPGGVDGVFGESTAVAVTRFQQSAGIEQDGVVGSVTWNRLFPPAAGDGSFNSAVTPTPAPVQPPVSSTPAVSNPYPILRRGARGAAVLGLQTRLRAIGVLNGEADGIFGEETEEAVKAAQSQFQLDPDGIVGPATWEALVRQ